MSWRAQPSVVVDLPAPQIVAGVPVVPTYFARALPTITCILGANGLHTERPPVPQSAAGGGYTKPPATTVWTARWSVDTLPAPSHFGGSYWLGERSSLDGTLGLPDSAAAWYPDPGTPNAPHWHSIFPFKPSVTAVTHYLPGGAAVEHPKGVNFNSHYIEHMWMNFAGARRQPFTWVIAAMVTDWQSETQIHYLLDSGRDPRDVGFPSLSASDCGTSRHIKDDLNYRNLIAITQGSVRLAAVGTDAGSGGMVRVRGDALLRPKMFIGIFNGADSYVGAWSPGRKLLRKGTIRNTSAQQHRYYVLGRRYGLISQERAGSLLVFEMRYWANRALTHDDLDEQYTQLASRWKFAAYKGH